MVRPQADHVARALLVGIAVLLVATGSRPVSATTGVASASGRVDHVLVISIDGLNTKALTQLGRSGLPHLWRLLEEGRSTLNARTAVEKTVTLPNHAGMITGRRVKADLGGHGVNINGYSDTTVHALAGEYVSSIFEVASDAGLDTALYTGKDKFDLFDNSWPDAIDTFTLTPQMTPLVTAAREDLLSDETELIFLHLQGPDKTGHRYGFMSPEYLATVRDVDAEIGRLLSAVDADAEVADSLAIVVTADHGGATGSTGHNSRTTLENLRVPFAAWGVGVTPGDLYAINPAFRDPGDALVNYRGLQPVRNANVANLAMDLLGLGTVPGSGIDPGQLLQVG